MSSIRYRERTEALGGHRADGLEAARGSGGPDFYLVGKLHRSRAEGQVARRTTTSGPSNGATARNPLGRWQRLILWLAGRVVLPAEIADPDGLPPGLYHSGWCGETASARVERNPAPEADPQRLPDPPLRWEERGTRDQGRIVRHDRTARRPDRRCARGPAPLVAPPFRTRLQWTS